MTRAKNLYFVFFALPPRRGRLPAGAYYHGKGFRSALPYLHKAPPLHHLHRHKTTRRFRGGIVAFSDFKPYVLMY